jgi:hypothetical protein
MSIVDMNSQCLANNDVGCLRCKKSVAFQLPRKQVGVAPMASSSTFGCHMAWRLVEIEIQDVFFFCSWGLQSHLAYHLLMERASISSVVAMSSMSDMFLMGTHNPEVWDHASLRSQSGGGGGRGSTSSMPS